MWSYRRELKLLYFLGIAAFAVSIDSSLTQVGKLKVQRASDNKPKHGRGLVDGLVVALHHMHMRGQQLAGVALSADQLWGMNRDACARAVDATLTDLGDSYLDVHVPFYLESVCDHSNIYEDFGGNRSSCQIIFASLSQHYQKDKDYKDWCTETASNPSVAVASEGPPSPPAVVVAPLPGKAADIVKTSRPVVKNVVKNLAPAAASWGAPGGAPAGSPSGMAPGSAPAGDMTSSSSPAPAPFAVFAPGSAAEGLDQQIKQLRKQRDESAEDVATEAAARKTSAPVTPGIPPAPTVSESAPDSETVVDPVQEKLDRISEKRARGEDIKEDLKQLDTLLAEQGAEGKSEEDEEDKWNVADARAELDRLEERQRRGEDISADVKKLQEIVRQAEKDAAAKKAAKMKKGDTKKKRRGELRPHLPVADKTTVTATTTISSTTGGVSEGSADIQDWGHMVTTPPPPTEAPQAGLSAGSRPSKSEEVRGIEERNNARIKKLEGDVDNWGALQHPDLNRGSSG